MHTHWKRFLNWLYEKRASIHYQEVNTRWKKHLL